jgi:CarD family transcriptional regulator
VELSAFKVGDKVIHPSHGAGVVTEIKELGFFGRKNKPYYSIELLSEPGTVVMVPVKDASKVGLRHPLSRSQLSRVWRRLRAEPKALPSDHKERYNVVRTRIEDGDLLEIAAVLRDLWWKDYRIRKLTTEGKRLYEKGMRLLASEIAVIQDSELAEAEAQISETLDEQVKDG